MLFKSFAKSVLDFGYLAWGPAFVSDADILERVESKATELVPPISYRMYDIKAGLRDSTGLSMRDAREVT